MGKQSQQMLLACHQIIKKNVEDLEMTLILFENYDRSRSWQFAEKYSVF